MITSEAYHTAAALQRKGPCHMVRTATIALFVLTFGTRPFQDRPFPERFVVQCDAVPTRVMAARWTLERATAARRDFALAHLRRARVTARLARGVHDHHCRAVPKRRVAHVRLCRLCQLCAAVTYKETDYGAVLQAGNLGAQGPHSAGRVQLQGGYENCAGADRLDGNCPRAVLLLLLRLLRVKARGKRPC
jgi:hypothetical protein